MALEHGGEPRAGCEDFESQSPRELFELGDELGH